MSLAGEPQPPRPGWPLPGPWLDDAACRNDDPELWFPEAERNRKPDVEYAVSVCLTCPVQAKCLSYAMANEPLDAVHGVWGGSTPRQRRKLYRKDRIHRTPAKPVSAPRAARGPRPTSLTGTGHTAAEVRVWAQAAGVACSSQGIVPRAVVEAFLEAVGDVGPVDEVPA